MSEGIIWRLYSMIYNMNLLDIIVTSFLAISVIAIPITRIIMLIKERRK